MAEKLVPVIETDGIGALQPSHASHQIGLGGFKGDVIMIWHEAIGMHLPAGFLARFSQRFYEVPLCPASPEMSPKGSK